MNLHFIQGEGDIVTVISIVAVDGTDGHERHRIVIGNPAPDIAGMAAWSLSMLPDTVTESLGDLPIRSEEGVCALMRDGKLGDAVEELQGLMKEYCGPSSLFHVSEAAQIELGHSLRQKVRDHDRALQKMRRETGGALEDADLFQAACIVLSQRDNAYAEAKFYKERSNG